jgi:hypothetical protein
MSDVNSLNGSSVRDTSGRTGRIVAVTPTGVALAWMRKGLIAEEAQLDRAALATDIQVLTLKEGWQPLVVVAGIAPIVPPSTTAALIEELEALVEKTAPAKPKIKKISKSKSKKSGNKKKGGETPSAAPEVKKPKAPRKFFGKKKHSPFKRFPKLGPAEGGQPREVQKALQWDCNKQGTDQQKCVRLKKDASGRLRKSKQPEDVKMVHTNRARKAAYQRVYKRWSTQQGWHQHP